MPKDEWKKANDEKKAREAIASRITSEGERKEVFGWISDAATDGGKTLIDGARRGYMEIETPAGGKEVVKAFIALKNDDNDSILRLLDIKGRDVQRKKGDVYINARKLMRAMEKEVPTVLH